MASGSIKRRYEFDWLRVFAILVVFLYHSTRFFNLENWHIKNIDTYVWVEIFTVFTTRWMMPLFFIISGVSLFYALGKSGGFRRFYEDKFLRLFIPVLVASLTHGALQVYLEKVSHGRFSGSFFSFIPTYFNGIYYGIGLAGSGNFANVGMHLWYLIFLFVYSLICYRLFVWFKAGGKGLLDKTTSFAATPGLIIPVLIAPLLVMKAIIPHSVLDVGNGGWGFLYYLWFLIAGFIIASSDRLQSSIQKQRWISFLLGTVVSIIYLTMLFGVSAPVFQGKAGDWISTLLNFFGAWCWLFAILGFAMKHLTFDRPGLRKANEAVLPFFIMHQSVLVVFGFFIVNWNIPDFLKWALVFSSAFVFIVASYILIVQRFELFRFLFGMKTSQSFYRIFRKKGVLIAAPVIWLGLSVFALINMTPNTGQNRYPMAMVYHPSKDIVLNAESITEQSPTGVKVVNDSEASIGKAIELESGATSSVKCSPQVYFEARFAAAAGRYFAWIRGKSDTDSEMTDSFWMQVDNQIGTNQGSVHLGNWNTFQPVGVYAWGSDVQVPVEVVLHHSGSHTVLVQPRQVPHRIDQIWLSHSQYRIPDSNQPVR